MVYASSGQVVIGFSGRLDNRCDGPVFPQNVYGAAKCWGEALARVYSDQYGISCICVRLGSPLYRQDGGWEPDDVMAHISHRDMAQLFALCIEKEGIDFAIVNAVSRHRRSWMEVEETCRLLGYVPRDGTAFPKRSVREPAAGREEKSS